MLREKSKTQNMKYNYTYKIQTQTKLKYITYECIHKGKSIKRKQGNDVQEVKLVIIKMRRGGLYWE